MNYTLKNEELTVTVAAKGAEVISVKRGDCEYVWQGNAQYWKGQAPLLFPICGRLNDGKYTYGGKTYEMTHHGFLRATELACINASDEEVSFCLEADEKTLACYPFSFALTVTYRLVGSRLAMTVKIENRGDVEMPATFGGHPGFNVPLDGDSSFEDWYLEFSEESDPDRIEIAPSGLQSGVRSAYPLVDRRILPLSREAFVIDGIFLARAARKVTLKSARSPRSVTLEYPDMPYLGIWQPPQSDAPFVCIEPWCGLPDYDKRPLDLSQKAQMFRLPPNTERTVGFDILFE